MKSSLLDKQEGKGPFNFVIQWHHRGRSIHSDIRFDVGTHLIGLTLDDPGKLGKASRLSNNQEFSSKNKILSRVKNRQPKEWLKFEGELNSERNEKIMIRDKGTFELGVQKATLFEVFLEGRRYQGRFIGEKIQNKGILNWMKNRGESWLFWKPVNQSPNILSNKSIIENFVPEAGISALPKGIEDKVPSRLRWWERNETGKVALEKIKEVRELMLQAGMIKEEGTEGEFSLLKKEKGFIFKIERGICLDLEDNPLENSKVNSRINIEEGEEGEILDRGRVRFEKINSELFFKINGRKLKGLWKYNELEEGSFGRIEEKKKEKGSYSNQLSERQIEKISELSEEPDNSLSDIAKKVGCSKSTVRYHLSNE